MIEVWDCKIAKLLWLSLHCTSSFKVETNQVKSNVARIATPAAGCGRRSAKAEGSFSTSIGPASSRTHVSHLDHIHMCTFTTVFFLNESRPLRTRLLRCLYVTLQTMLFYSSLRFESVLHICCLLGREVWQFPFVFAVFSIGQLQEPCN